MMSRSWFIGSAMLLALAAWSTAAESFRDDWYFSREEIESAYRYQSNYGERINNPLRARRCHFGKKNFPAIHGGREIQLSCRFITRTIAHLTEMLNAGAVRFLFSLDANHAHLGVPKTIWQKKYADMPPENVLSAIFEEPSLVALYHTAEHLEPVDPKTGKVDRRAREWKEKRNVMGYYDERRIEILPPLPGGAGAGLPESYRSYGGFRFLASPGGQLSLFHQGSVTQFDISLDFGASRDDPDSVL